MRLFFALLISSSLTLSNIVLADSSPTESMTDNVPDAVSGEELREDLSKLYAELQKSHYDLFARRPRVEYDAKLEEALADIPKTVSNDDAKLIVQRFLAYGNIAHATTALPVAGWKRFREAGGRFFPLRLRVVNGRAYVMDDLHGKNNVSPGDELVSVEGRAAREWLEGPRALLSADNDYFAYALLEDSLPELDWYLDGAADLTPAEIRTRDGSVKSVQLRGATAKEEAATLAQRTDATWAKWTEREFRWLSGDIAYVRPGPFYNHHDDAPSMWDVTEFQAFIDASFEQINSRETKDLIIDLRNNPGGDSSFSDRLLERIATKSFRFASAFEVRVSESAIASNNARLVEAPDNPNIKELAEAFRTASIGSTVRITIPEVSPARSGRFDGHVYVLINRHSYSNTVFVAATVQDYGFGTLLGEETADLANTYGAIETFTLPNSGLAINFPKARIVRPNGQIDVRGVVPDILIDAPLTATDRDVVLERALEIIRERR